MISAGSGGTFLVEDFFDNIIINFPQIIKCSKYNDYLFY
jgi:hypothetical protein